MRETERWLEEELVRIHGEVSRMLRRIVPEEQWRAMREHKGFTPPADVYETDQQLVVRVEIAGVDEAAWEVSFANQVLTVKGHRHDPAEKLAYQQMEIPYGEFRADIFLPQAVDAAGIEAKYDNGFLTVTLPRIPGPQKVPVAIRPEENSS